MQETRWPTWAPEEAISYYESIFEIFGACELKILLTHASAKNVWSKLDRSGVSCTMFCDALLKALTGPTSDKSPGELKKHLEIISKKAYELALLVDEVHGLNTVFQQEYEQRWFKANSTIPEIDWPSDYYRYYRKTFCDELIHISNLATNYFEPIHEKPAVENADAIFFIKSLDSFFRLTTHKPHTGITLLCAELLFPDYPVSKKSIERATSRKRPPIKRKIIEIKGG